MAIETITIEELHARFKAQGVSAREHLAFKCVICGTVQSMASLIAAGCAADKAESLVGFSCEGRLTGAGAWPSNKKKDAKSVARRKVRGCDWTLGGLFRLHHIEVTGTDGKPQPIFDLATPEEAQALQGIMQKTESTVGA
jgi:hypothetical protein